jgi:Skp family chaperone for outer membrane proteins
LRLVLKDWQDRQDSISIRLAITEALWEEWDKQEAPRLARQVKREEQEIAKAITDGRLPQDVEQKVAEQMKMTKRQKPYEYDPDYGVTISCAPDYRATISEADYKAMTPCNQVSYNRERLDVTETILRSLSEDLVRTLRTRDEDGERAERGDL